MRFRTIAIALALITCAQAFGQGAAIVPLSNVNVSLNRSNAVNYGLNLDKERYYVFAPSNYKGDKAFGLVVYIAPDDSFSQLPDGWAEVLTKHKLFLIAPQGAGNHCDQAKRMGLGILGALSLMSRYKIDPARVYSAGLSGGARTAGDMGFYQPDLFHGTIQCCGSNFYYKVPKYYATSETDTNGNPYGTISVPQQNVAAAKAKVRFVLITGSGDFRRGNVADIYWYGFNQQHFNAKMIDVPGMGHQNCDGATLEQALNYIAGSTSTSTTKKK
jgi:hypothetical protein